MSLKRSDICLTYIPYRPFLLNTTHTGDLFYRKKDKIGKLFGQKHGSCALLLKKAMLFGQYFQKLRFFI